MDTERVLSAGGSIHDESSRQMGQGEGQNWRSRSRCQEYAGPRECGPYIRLHYVHFVHFQQSGGGIRLIVHSNQEDTT
jgi:hypothetical protein